MTGVGKRWVAGFGVLLGCLPALHEDESLAASDRAATDASGCVASTASDVAAVPGAPPASVIAATVRVSEALPNWTPECTSCIQQACSPELSACASDGPCLTYASCRWAQDAPPSPGAEETCERDYGASDEAPASPLRKLSNCWQNSCVSACALGTAWACVHDYRLPAPASDEPIVVRQVLEQLFSDEPIPGANVRFCDALAHPDDCASGAFPEAATDCGGIAAVALPVASDDRLGWSGSRLVSGEGLAPVRMQTNLPMRVGRYSLQHVPTVAQVQALTTLFQGDPSLGHVVFQVFDCAHTGGDDVVVEASAELPGTEVTTPTTRIRYQRGQGLNVRLDDPSATATSADGDGGGSITNLVPGLWIRISARLAGTGAEVAATRIITRPGELLLLELHPDPEGE